MAGCQARETSSFLENVQKALGWKSHRSFDSPFLLNPLFSLTIRFLFVPWKRSQCGWDERW
jgi:hypothetical protein